LIFKNKGTPTQVLSSEYNSLEQMQKERSRQV